MKFREFFLFDDCGRRIMRSDHSQLPPQNRALREHYHSECELSLFLRGRGIYSVHGTEYPFETGDVFLFGSNEAHCITRVDEEMELLNIKFEPSLLWERAEGTELLGLFLARRRGFSNRFAGGDRILRETILSIERELSQDEPCRTVACRWKLFSVFIHMIRTYDCVDRDRVISTPSTVTGSLRRVIDYVNDNLEKKLTLRELAEVAHMTPTYFSTVFKKFNGVSPFEYIVTKRVEMAVDLLRRTDMTKLEIAEQCGFSGSSNFYKAFAKVTGKTPSDYVRR